MRNNKGSSAGIPLKRHPGDAALAFALAVLVVLVLIVAAVAVAP